MGKDKVKSAIPYILVGILILSNLYFFVKYTVLKENTDYVKDISGRINFAAELRETDLVEEVASIQGEDFLMPLIEEVADKASNGYRLENYIVLKYDNDNTLLIEVVQDKEGKFLFQDMFFLDETNYDRLFQ